MLKTKRYGNEETDFSYLVTNPFHTSSHTGILFLVTPIHNFILGLMVYQNGLLLWERSIFPHWRITTIFLFLFLNNKNLNIINGFMKRNMQQMVLLTRIKHVMYWRVFYKLKELIISRPFPLLPRVFFYMEIFMRKFTWRNILVLCRILHMFATLTLIMWSQTSSLGLVWEYV